jgi:hypothetical protein
MPPLLLKGSSSSRSYRVILPSSFNIVLSYALVFSTIPPASVFSTVLFSYPFPALSNFLIVLLYTKLKRLIEVGTGEYPLCHVFTESLRDRLSSFPRKFFHFLNEPKPWIFGGTLPVLIATYASICNSGVN